MYGDWRRAVTADHDTRPHETPPVKLEIHHARLEVHDTGRARSLLATIMEDVRAPDPIFRIIEKDLRGLVDGHHFFDPTTATRSSWSAEANCVPPFGCERA
jgi:hypothetical protein